jgi:hypothetical protein
MGAKSKGSRHKLGEPLTSDLADFCVASWGAPEKEIIKAALTDFIERRLTMEPELRKRFEEAREARLGEQRKLTVLKGGKG